MKNYFLQGKEIARSGAEAVLATALSVESGSAIQVRIPNIHPLFLDHETRPLHSKPGRSSG